MRTIAILRYLTAIALAVASATAATTPAPCVTLTMEGDNTIEDGAIGTAVVKLQDACTASPPTEVEVAAPGLLCGRTKFTFKKGDRSTYEQRVTCRTATGSATGADGELMDVPVTLTYKKGPRPSDSCKFRRKVRHSGHCHGSGDPHVTTLDGVTYDLHNQGVFRLFSSGNFQVQIFQEKCGPVDTLRDQAPGCYQGVAVAFGASVARFLIVDGKLQLGKGSASLQWLTIEKVGNPNTEAYRVFTNVDQATYVDINLERWETYNSYPYLNVALQVSPYFKRADVTGLMGNWNGNRNDDVTNVDQLVAAHGVAINNNLFTCVSTGCTPLLKASTIADSNAIALPSGDALLHQGYVVVAADAVVMRGLTPKVRTFRQLQRVASAGDYSAGRVDAEPVATPFRIATKNGNANGAAVPQQNANTTVTASSETRTTIAMALRKNNPGAPQAPTTGAPASNPSAAPVPTPAPTTAAAADVTPRATELCNQVISSVASVCSKYVSDTNWYIQTACVADAVLLRDLSVVDTAKLSYLRACRRELDALMSTKTASTSETEQLTSDRAALLFGDLSRCHKECSGRGQCLPAGCECNSGYTGHGCDIAI